jgi:hypothetical protein
MLIRALRLKPQAYRLEEDELCTTALLKLVAIVSGVILLLHVLYFIASALLHVLFVALMAAKKTKIKRKWRQQTDSVQRAVTRHISNTALSDPRRLADKLTVRTDTGTS